MIADRGYYKGTQILDAEKAGVQTYIPKPMTSGSKVEGRFSKADYFTNGALILGASCVTSRSSTPTSTRKL